MIDLNKMVNEASFVFRRVLYSLCRDEGNLKLACALSNVWKHIVTSIDLVLWASQNGMATLKLQIEKKAAQHIDKFAKEQESKFESLRDLNR